MRGWWAGVVAALGALLVGAPAAVAGDATAFQLNPAHTGYSPDSLPPTLQQRWSVDLGRQVSHPLIADGKVFVLAQGVQLPGRTDPVYALFGLDQQTGKVLWRTLLDFPGPWPSPLAYDNGRIFLATAYDVPAEHTAYGAVDAYDARTGARVWRRGGLNYSWVFDGPPVAADGVVYATGSGYGGSVYAVRQSDGALLWSVEVNASDSGVTLSPTRVYTAGACHFYAFDRATGAVAWVHDGGCTGGLEFLPVLYEGRLFARMSGPVAIQVFDAAGGQVVGSFPMDSQWDPPPAFAGKLRVQVSGARATLSAYDNASGARRWEFAGDRTLQSAPVIAGDTAFVGGKSGRVYGVDLATGQERWHADTGQPVRPPDWWDNSVKPGLAVGGGMLIVPATGRLVAYGPPKSAPTVTRRPRFARVKLRCRTRCRAAIVLRLARKHDRSRVAGRRRVTLTAGTHRVKVRLRTRALARVSGRVHLTARIALTAIDRAGHRKRGRPIVHRSRRLVVRVG
jgi:outer membrane protein assembly factor BamB